MIADIQMNFLMRPNDILVKYSVFSSKVYQTDLPVLNVLLSFYGQSTNIRLSSLNSPTILLQKLKMICTLPMLCL